MSQEPLPTPEYTSPPWGRTMKSVVTIITLLLFALLAYRFQSLIAQLVIAVILAYLLNPIVNFVDERTSLKRSTVILLAYLLVAAAFIWALIALGVAAYQQISTLIDEVPLLIDRVTDVFQDLTTRTEPIHIGSFQLDPIIIPWDSITNQIVGLLEPALSQSGQFVGQAATTVVGLVGQLFFVFVISIYVAIEIPKLGGYVGDFAQTPGYRYDAERLTREFGRIWSAYLRGQVILGLVIGFLVWLGLSILGVQNALALGILSGLLEFIPVLGPVIGAGAAVAVALVQPVNYFGLLGWQYALVVLGLMFIIQQLENNLLVPRIVGDALDLHPLLVMVAVFMGGAIAGILGAILAAPVVATLKLVGVYAWRKMFDLHPFPVSEEEMPPPAPPLRERLRGLWHRGRDLLQRMRRR
ncbi:MAG: AI-2E family transporter [Ardenticatenaceae bacterium]|nr:AI-2E family transporter [Anaerolineales bacterium]MCB8920186.1 AI-2E family transporter [Ardenticatenaceae bacterium]